MQSGMNRLGYVVEFLDSCWICVPELIFALLSPFVLVYFIMSVYFV